MSDPRRSQSHTIEIEESPPASDQARSRSQTVELNSSPLNELPPEALDKPPVPVSVDLTQLKLARAPLRFLRKVAWGVATLVGVGLGYQAWQLVDWAFEWHWSLGAAVSGGLLALAGMAAVSVWDFYSQNRAFKRIQALRADAQVLKDDPGVVARQSWLERLQGFYRGKPQADLLTEKLNQLPDYSDGRETIAFINNHYLQALDVEARQRLIRYARQSGLLVALSSSTGLDVLFALWRALKMIDEIAMVYGIRPSLSGRLQLLRKVVELLAFTGSSELAIEYLLPEIVTGSLGATLSARLAQGVGAALLTARIGIATMELCRPAAFGPEQKPAIGSIGKQICLSLTDDLRKKKEEHEK